VIVWAKGGEARVAAFAPDGAITLGSTIPSPPGSRLEGSLEGSRVRVKIHSARKKEDGTFVLEGRVLDLTREMRDRLTEELGRPTKEPGEPG
jgi:hypothetical protein